MAGSVFETDACVRGQHVNKAVWTPVIAEIIISDLKCSAVAELPFQGLQLQLVELHRTGRCPAKGIAGSGGSPATGNARGGGRPSGSVGGGSGSPPASGGRVGDGDGGGGPKQLVVVEVVGLQLRVVLVVVVGLLEVVMETIHLQLPVVMEEKVLHHGNHNPFTTNK
uniref:Uncharacterized protein n=1 Tax=Amphimedon queenslandica TaxID=400682 RepID=A0A1X7TX42_AMPQE